MELLINIILLAVAAVIVWYAPAVVGRIIYHQWCYMILKGIADSRGVDIMDLDPETLTERQAKAWINYTAREMAGESLKRR